MLLNATQPGNDSALVGHPDGVYQFGPRIVLGWYIGYGTISVLSVCGNVLVIFVVLRRHQNNVDNMFIINLAIADVLTGLIAAPFRFQAALLQRWTLPSFMCQLLPFIDTLSLGVCVMTLTVCAIDRFVTVFVPNTRRINLRTANKIVVLIWIFSTMCSTPYGVLHRVFTFNKLTGELVNASFVAAQPDAVAWVCLPIHGESVWWRGYNVYLTIIQYFIPLIVIDTSYLAIGVKIFALHLRNKRLARRPGIPFCAPPKSGQSRGGKKVMLLLALVVVLFTCCWLPYETYLLLAEVSNVNDFYYINIVFMCSHFLAMSNSCVNPFIYGIFNRRFRRDYKSVMHHVISPREAAKAEAARKASRKTTKASMQVNMAQLQQRNGHSSQVALNEIDQPLTLITTPWQFHRSHGDDKPTNQYEQLFLD